MNRIYNVKISLILFAIILFMIPGYAQKSLTSDTPQNSQSLKGNGLCFTPNKGQIADMAGKLCPDVLYKGETSGADIYLRKTGISYVYSNMGDVMHEVDGRVEKLIQAGAITEADEHKRKEELMQKENIKVHRVDMDFANCNENIKQLNEDEVDGYNNYYYAHCPNGILNVKQYNKVTYKNIYDGIDISYYGSKENGIKYDLIVQPHADPNQIKLHWKGVESIHLNREGNLIIKTSVNEFTESIPKVYQVINGEVIDVKTKYVLTPISNGEAIINFSISIFNSSFPLVVDPWATYYGGTGNDQGSSVACDNTGYVYLAGTTWSPNTGNVMAITGFQTVWGGSEDAFLVKFNSATGARTWATYYGGTGNDHGSSVACDNTGNVYLAGATTSPNAGNVMAITPGFQTVYGGGGGDAFLVQFNSGTGLRDWATYYGDTGDDYGYSVACDNAGNVYLAGTTTSPNAGNVMATTGAWQTVLGLGWWRDAFLVKFNSVTGLRDWGTYYGGLGGEYGYSVACDNADNVYLSGQTSSPNVGNVMASVGAHQTVLGGVDDAFLVKFDPAGVRNWGTYYGGTGWEYGYSVACDNAGNVYMAGITTSNTGTVIATATGFQTGFGGGGIDAFLVKFNSGTGARDWGTYYGSTLTEAVAHVGCCLAIDGNNNVYLYMEVEDKPGPALDPCAYQPNYAGGGEDQMIVKFSPAGQKLCATYFGGSGYEDLDYEGGIAVSGNLLFICTTNTTGGYPVSPGAHQTVHGGGSYDAVLACLCTNICEGKVLALSVAATPATTCANTPITFTPAVSNSCDTSGYKYHWVFTGGNPATSESMKPTVSFPGVGTHDVKLIVTTLCKKDSVIKPSYITVNNCGCALSSAVVSMGNTSCSAKSDGSAAITISNGSGGPYTYNWSNGTTGTTTNTTILVNGLSASTYTVTITEGACTSTAMITIGSPPPLLGQFTKGTANCSSCGCKEWIMVNARGGTSPYTYLWPDGYDKRYKNQLCPGVYTINIKDKNGCTVNVILTAP